MAKIKSIKIPIQMGTGNEKTERREMELKWGKSSIYKWKTFFSCKTLQNVSLSGKKN